MGYLTDQMQDQISTTLRKIVDLYLEGYPGQYRTMVLYQLGLDHKSVNLSVTGKRLRPLFVLLSCGIFDRDWMDALPAASAVELLHNFSLVHDDIQDSSETRRGRDTVWKKWGIPQAINTGDALLNLAYLSVFELQGMIDNERINQILFSLQKTCMELTKGQHLDIAHETKKEIPLELYLQMINGKTAALISASLKIGAMVAGASTAKIKVMEKLGNSLGQAFQIQDDYLGIWGDEKVTGKSTYSDLMSKKKTYPIILGINNKKTFSEMWSKHNVIDIENASYLATILEEEGIRDQVSEKIETEYKIAWRILEQDIPTSEISNSFVNLVKSLQSRNN